jgi:hypothetical protein
MDGNAALAALGLEPGASVREVKEAFRRRVKTVHPDHRGSVEDFHRLHQAYAAACVTARVHTSARVTVRGRCWIIPAPTRPTIVDVTDSTRAVRPRHSARSSSGRSFAEHLAAALAR